MSSLNHKRSDLTVAIIAAVAVAAFSVITISCSRSDTPQKEKKEISPRSAPLMDLDVKKVVPVDELDVDSKDSQALSLMADRYFEARNYAQAAEVYKKVIELSPEDVDTYNDLGLVYHYTNRSALALDTLKKGTTLDPSFQRIWLSYGFVLMVSGQTAEAKTAFGKVIELDPDNDVGQEAQRMLGGLK
jgi:cytochrome c-type biogenesis protein CcmH/NrfG